jgi:uncharacterized protein YecE (DUF72 family)
MASTPALAPALEHLRREQIYLGTSSWKYEGWLGDLYTPERYLYRGKLSKTRFERDCLEEYATTFSSVCADSSYYRFPTDRYLAKLYDPVGPHFRMSHKVTDTITIKHFPQLARHGEFAGQANPHFLNAPLFLSSFLKPLTPFREQTGLLMFEFSRFYPRDFEQGRDFVEQLDRFLAQLPTDEWDFGVEVRNSSLLDPLYFDTLARHQVAHVYNQWSRMPPLAEQFSRRAPAPDSPAGARLLLKEGRPYQEAVDQFSPYDRIQEPQPAVRAAAAALIKARQDQAKRPTYVYVNNRLEGNALGTIAAILDLLGKEG